MESARALSLRGGIADEAIHRLRRVIHRGLLRFARNDGRIFQINGCSFRLALAALAALITALPAPAAELKINPPTEEEGQVSLEDNSALVLRRGHSSDPHQTHFVELGYGVTEYWWTEIEGHWESDLGGLKYRTTDFENAFRIFREGEWLPVTSLFLEYDQPTDGKTPSTATIGGLFGKTFGPSQTVINLLLDHDMGRHAVTGVRLRYNGISTWQFIPEIAPGIEFFGEPGKLGSFARAGAQDHRLGPVLHGAREIEEVGDFAYNIGYVFGVTPAAPRGTLVWRLEFGRDF